MDSKYSIRSIFFVEMSSMISVTLFSRPISCRASSSVRFLFITTGRISLMISLICRFTTSLPDTKAVSPIVLRYTQKGGALQEGLHFRNRFQTMPCILYRVLQHTAATSHIEKPNTLSGRRVVHERQMRRATY